VPAGQRCRGEHADHHGDDVLRTDVAAQRPVGGAGVQDGRHGRRELLARLGHGHGAGGEDGTSDPAHLAENLAVAAIRLPPASLAALDNLAA